MSLVAKLAALEKAVEDYLRHVAVSVATNPIYSERVANLACELFPEVGNKVIQEVKDNFQKATKRC